MPHDDDENGREGGTEQDTVDRCSLARVVVGEEAGKEALLASGDDEAAANPKRDGQRGEAAGAREEQCTRKRTYEEV